MKNLDQAREEWSARVQWLVREKGLPFSRTDMDVITRHFVSEEMAIQGDSGMSRSEIQNHAQALADKFMNGGFNDKLSRIVTDFWTSPEMNYE